MIAIGSVALRRPYTFIVLAVLTLIFGVLAAVHAPTGILPNKGIPVVSMEWTGNGFPPDDMSEGAGDYFDRSATTPVNDSEHRESPPLSGDGISKMVFQGRVNINAALALVTAASQTVLKLLPSAAVPALANHP